MTDISQRELGVTQQGHYAGAVSRLVAFVCDEAIATICFSVATASLTYLVVLITPDNYKLELPPSVLSMIYVFWLFLYFSYPWSTSGKTPGMAILGLRVVQRDGSATNFRCGLTRTVMFPLGFLTFGLGFVGILTNREHLAIYDRIAKTAVVYDWDARGARLRFLARSSAPSSPDYSANQATNLPEGSE
ncbi:MAG: RDD family protein [Microthrixaceae bacterium]